MPSDHRLHPSSILFGLAGSLRAFLFPAIVVLLTTGRSSPDSSDPGNWGPARWMNRWMPGDVEIANWQFWFLLFLIPAAMVALARYFSFRLRYEGTELVIRSGILFRNERHVPYARIQNLDAVRNVVHRLFGVAEVRVETGGGQTPEATISVLHESVFEEMRRRVFEGRSRANAPGEDAPAASDEAVSAVEPQTLLHLPFRELLLNGLLDNRGVVVIAAMYGVLWEFGLFRVVWERWVTDSYAPGLLRDTVTTLAAGRLPSLGRIGVILAGLIGLLVLVRVLSMIWSVLRLYDFRLSRVGEDVRTEYGLLTRITATIPLQRVQTLTIRETPLQRLVKRMSVRVETAGGHASPHDGPKQPREWLAPIIRHDAVPALVREVLPGFELSTLKWQPLHPRAFRRAVKAPILFAFVMTIPFLFWFGRGGLVMLPIFVTWLIGLTWIQVRHTQWAVSDDTLASRSGWLWRNVIVVPVVKIQAVGRIESPFDRRTAMAGVRVDTAGSGAPAHRISIPYLARETAAALYERLATQTAQTAFRW
jgi:putative membrane protein